MKKTTSKKFVGGLLVAIIMAAIGAVIAIAETGETNENGIQQASFFGRRPIMCGEPPFMSQLTVEQRQELEDIITSMKEDGATRLEIRDTIVSKLEEYGVEIQKPELTEEELDERLEEKIEHTEQRLEILNRVKELRDQGYSYEEIREMIQEEFDLEDSKGDFQGKKFRHKHHCGPWGD
jgi:DNA-binding transcriptional MerR regulator